MRSYCCRARVTGNVSSVFVVVVKIGKSESFILRKRDM